MITFVTAVTVLTQLILAGVIFLRNKKNKTHLVISFFIFCLATWTIANFFSLKVSSVAEKLFWVRMVMLVTSPLPIFFYLVTLLFPLNKEKLPQKKIMLGIGTMLLLAGLSFTPLMFKDYFLSSGQPHVTPGPAILLYAVNFILFCGAGIVNLFSKLKKEKGKKKEQSFYFLVGLILTSLGGFVTNFISVVVFNSLQFVWLGPCFSLFLVAFLSYAIIKHRFLDIRVLIFRSVVYLCILLSICFLYSAGFMLISYFFFGRNLGQVSFQQALIFTLLASLLFQPLKNFFEVHTERLFFAGRYNPSLVLKEMSSTLSASIVLDELEQKTADQLKQLMGIKEVLLYIPVQGKNEPLNNLLISLYSEKKQIHIFDELEESKQKNFLRKNMWEVVCVFRTNKKRIAGLFLGEKQNGQSYSVEDIEILQILTPQLSLAVDHALSYKHIANFNQQLKEEVSLATTELRQANSRLQDLDRLKNEFVSIASHELRTPMTAIKNSLWLALFSSNESFSTSTKKYLKTAYNSTERLLRLVQDILTVSKIEANNFTLKPKKVDIKKLISNVMMENEALQKKKKISLQLSEISAYTLFIDAEKIHLVLQNILGNAIKFTPSKGVIRLTSTVLENTYILSISDTGPGISEDDMCKLFEKFSRIEKSYAKTPESGTGLGLYISQQIMKMHQGKIEVTSQIKKGTTFSLHFPLYLKKG
jgi:signal transduction histidine kinase